MPWDALEDLFHQEVNLSVRDSIAGPLSQTEMPAGLSGCVVLVSVWLVWCSYRCGAWFPPASADERVVGPALGLCLLWLTSVAVRTARLLLWFIVPPASDSH